MKKQFEGFIPKFLNTRAINHQKINPSICQILKTAVNILHAKISISDLVDLLKKKIWLTMKECNAQLQ